MNLAAEFPNDQELGSKVREQYWRWWKDTKSNDPNQLTLKFPKETEELIDTDIDSVAIRAED